MASDWLISLTRYPTPCGTLVYGRTILRLLVILIVQLDLQRILRAVVKGWHLLFDQRKGALKGPTSDQWHEDRRSRSVK
jgi:hypothetical protein